LPDPTFSASFPVGEEGDVINKVVDITGDTTVTMTIPFLRETYWEEVLDPITAAPPISQWNGFNGQLVMYIVTPVTNANSTTDSTVRFSVWTSGAEDFQIARPTTLWPNWSDGILASPKPGKEEVRMKAQMQTQSVDSAADMRDLFRKPFETIVPATTAIPQGIQHGETIDSWIELLHRYSLYDSTNQDSIIFNKTINPWDPFTSIYGVRNQYERIRRSFLFARGGFRIKTVLSGWDEYTTNVNSTTDSLWIRISNQFSGEQTDTLAQTDAGVTFNTGKQALSNEAEIPFYTKYNMHSLTFPIEQELLPLANIQIYSWWSPGDDNHIQADTYLSVSDSYTLGCPINPYPLLRLSSKSDNNNKSSDDPVTYTLIDPDQVQNKYNTKGGNRPQTGNFNTNTQKPMPRNSKEHRLSTLD